MTAEPVTPALGLEPPWNAQPILTVFNSMSSTNLLRSRDMPATLGFAAVSVVAATCLGIVAANDTISAVNPFYFNHTPDRASGAILDSPAGTDSMPSTQLAVDYRASAPPYAEDRSPYQPSAGLAPPFQSSGFDRRTVSDRIESDTVDEDQSIELEQVPASVVSDTASAADETGQPLERGLVADRDAQDTSLDSPDSAVVRFSAPPTANRPY